MLGKQSVQPINLRIADGRGIDRKLSKELPGLAGEAVVAVEQRKRRLPVIEDLQPGCGWIRRFSRPAAKQIAASPGPTGRGFVCLGHGSHPPRDKSLKAFGWDEGSSP